MTILPNVGVASGLEERVVVLERRAEVLADYDAWQVAKQAAESAAGMTQALQDCIEAWAVEKAVRLRIVDLRSHDPAALQLKLRIFVDSLSTVDWREGLDEMVARATEIEGGHWEDAFASIVRDLVTAYQGAPAHQPAVAIGGAA